jgi:exodeoxyribonuclease-3
VKIATWNVNSIRKRAAQVQAWLARESPDILLLQELKCEARDFPELDFAGLGYRAEIVGQKAYNGVAVLARIPFTVTQRALPGLAVAGDGVNGDGAVEARYIEITAAEMVIGGLYAPNGNSGGAAGFQKKLRWLDALITHARALLAADTPLVLAGDFNICPEDDDLAAGALAADDALVRPESRARFRTLLWLGMTDALRALTPEGPLYTFWDYQAGAFAADRGLRIDHVLLSPTLAERLSAATIDRTARAAEQPSDHVPVTVILR